jgi:hypothetical protein
LRIIRRRLAFFPFAKVGCECGVSQRFGKKSGKIVNGKINDEF